MCLGMNYLCFEIDVYVERYLRSVAITLLKSWLSKSFILL